MFLDGLDHFVDADLDAEVDDLVAIVGQNNVDEVLADVVDVTLHGGEHDPAATTLVGLFHEGLEVGHGHLHRLGTLQHEGQLHLAGREEFADDLHTFEEDVVDDGEGCNAPVHRGVEVILHAATDAVNNAAAQTVFEG